MKSSAPGSKTALVTGANRGIGLEIARQLTEHGWQVVMGARRLDAGKAAADSITKQGGSAFPIELNVADLASIRAAATEFGKRFEPIDVLINNAGIYPDEQATILTITIEQLTQTFRTNTFGPVAVTQAFLPFLRKATRPRVINISSGYGQLEGLSANVPSYCLSKLALNGVTLMLSEALAPDGIAVNSMCPGWVRTDMGGPGAARSVAEGADTGVWLATEAPQEWTGKFFRDRKEIPW